MRDSLLMTLVLAAAVFAQADPCKDETQKAEIFYKMCVKFDPQSSGYIDCVRLYMEQKAKADEACEAAPPAPAAAPPDSEPVPWLQRFQEPTVAPAPAPAPAAAFAAAAVMSVAQALRESSLPGGCVADFTALMESGGFSMGKFVKELPPAVAKVKVQMKSPFGKPKDGDRTSVGLTVGCIKSLPESPAEIQGLLKDIALKAGLSFAADAVENAAESYEPGEESSDDKKGVRFGIRVGLNANRIHSFSNSEGGNIGLALNVPLAGGIMSLNAGLDFYEYHYRHYDNIEMHEYAISNSVLLQLGNSFYVELGVQLDIPLVTSFSGYNGVSDYFEENRAFVDFDFVLGLGYKFTHIRIDLKYVHGLTDIFIGFNNNNNWREQGGLGVTYFF